MSIEKYTQLNNEYNRTTKTKNVAAYCRVSTDNEDQANSFESQQRYFREYIEKHSDWKLCGIYADEGVSGTSTKKRKEFLRMIDCACRGEIDLILTKEISRFARNTLDSISYTRQLKEHGVGVIFMNDNINTLDPDAELRLTIMSSIAQDEIRRTSERVKWGQQRRMEQGVVFGCSMLGYDVKDGKITVNEEGAKIVRLIFDKYVNEGKGTYVIGRELCEAGIFPMKAREWYNTVILRVIRNDKYCGDLVQKKNITPNYLDHKKKCNHGEEEFVIIRNHHEPIISREMFDKANQIADSRALSQEGKAKHSNRYPFSGKIKCGTCGASYTTRYNTRSDGSKYKAWRCSEATNHGKPHIDNMGNHVGCHSNSIRNEEAVHIMYLAAKNLKYNRKKIESNLIKVIESVLEDKSHKTDIGKLEREIEKEETKSDKLLDLYLEDSITKEKYEHEKTVVDGRIMSLREQISSINSTNEIESQKEEVFEEIKRVIGELAEGVDYEDEFYGKILNKMVIIDKHTIDVYLNILPEKWRFRVSSAAKPKCKKGASETEVPISVKSPIPILSGMVNL